VLSKDSKYLKALSAATAHSAQATTNCLNLQFHVVQSPAAKTPGKLVFIQLSTLIYHCSSLSSHLSNHGIGFGFVHTAIKTPSTSNLNLSFDLQSKMLSPSTHFSISIHSTFSLPQISTTTAGVIISTLGFDFNFSSRIGSHLNCFLL